MSDSSNQFDATDRVGVIGSVTTWVIAYISANDVEVIARTTMYLMATCVSIGTLLLMRKKLISEIKSILKQIKK